jgi:hypothetical protein
MNPNYGDCRDRAVRTPGVGRARDACIGYNQRMHILVRKKPRVRASGPLYDPGRRARATHPNPRVATRPTCDDRTVPQKHSLVQRNDQYSRKIPTKASCQIGPATIRRYGRPNAAGRALSLGYVSHLVSPLYSVKSFDQNHSCIQIPAACKRRNMSTHSLYS